MRYRFVCIILIAMPLLSLAPLDTSAEYRAYELVIHNTETDEQRLVVTTLDHIQYPGYHPLNAAESISYLDSWMCWGNTSSFKPICPNPRAEGADRRPSSTPAAP